MMRSKKSIIAVLMMSLALALAAGCDDDDDDNGVRLDRGVGDIGAGDAREAGPVEAGPVEAGPVEAGPVEAGPVEAGPVEAGPVEAGPVEAGPAEAGTADAGGGGGGGGGAAAVVVECNLVRPDAEVTISGLAFRPPTVNINAMEVVRWTNREAVLHTVTAGRADMPNPGLPFGSPPLGLGASFCVRFMNPGAHGYFCSLHPTTMNNGLVNVR